MVEKINDTAYSLQFHVKYQVNVTFIDVDFTSYNLQFHAKYQINVTFINVDFTLFHVDDELDSRMNLFKEGGNDMIQQGSNNFKYLLQWMKDPITKARPKRTKKPFKSLVMQVPKPRIISFVQLEDKFSKLKDNNLKSTMNQRVYTQDATMCWSLFGWIT